MLRVFVITCDKYRWALRGFVHQFRKYWNTTHSVVIVGYSPPLFELPSHIQFCSIAPDEYPAQQWSTGLIQFLRSVEDDHFVLLLDDYWLCRQANLYAIAQLHEFCKQEPRLLRMDLTDDRQYAGGMRDYDKPYCGFCDLIYTAPDTPYQMSLQAGIWNRKLMLDVLRANETAWEVEIAGTATDLRERGDDILVLGTRQRPLRYANVFQGGDASKESLRLQHLLPEDIEELREIGAI